MLSRFRNRTYFFRRILARPFVILGINPNFVSLLGLLLALGGAWFVFQQQWLFAFVLFLLAPAMDLVDGEVARQLKRQSNWGNYFETMLDKFVDFAMLGSFVFLYPVASVLALGFSMISSYAKPRVALIVVTDNRDWPAVGEHSDKLVVLLLSLALAALGINVIEPALYFIAMVCAVGSVQRMWYAKKLILQAERKGNLLPYIKKKRER